MQGESKARFAKRKGKAPDDKFLYNQLAVVYFERFVECWSFNFLDLSPALNDNQHTKKLTLYSFDVAWNFTNNFLAFRFVCAIFKQ